MTSVDSFQSNLEERDGKIIGPWRQPRQMLAEQTYEGHASIHDDATAQKLGFSGGTIEGPTHFSQFVPLGVAAFGPEFLSKGCLSAHYRAPVFEGERVRAILQKSDSGDHAEIRMERDDETEILVGSASMHGTSTPTALEARLETLRPLEQPVILRDVKVGDKSSRITVRMDMDQHMGDLYPFSLATKLKVITEPSPLYQNENAIIPFEMISVLLNHVAREGAYRTRGPAVGLFADQEIKVYDGPLLVGHDYEIEREIIAFSGSRRTESMWVKTRVFEPGSNDVIAHMLLNTATLKASYEAYEQEFAELYGNQGE